MNLINLLIFLLRKTIATNFASMWCKGKRR